MPTHSSDVMRIQVLYGPTAKARPWSAMAPRVMVSYALRLPRDLMPHAHLARGCHGRRSLRRGAAAPRRYSEACQRQSGPGPWVTAQPHDRAHVHAFRVDDGSGATASRVSPCPRGHPRGGMPGRCKRSRRTRHPPEHRPCAMPSADETGEVDGTVNGH